MARALWGERWCADALCAIVPRVQGNTDDSASAWLVALRPGLDKVLPPGVDVNTVVRHPAFVLYLRMRSKMDGTHLLSAPALPRDTVWGMCMDALLLYFLLHPDALEPTSQRWVAHLDRRTVSARLTLDADSYSVVAHCPRTEGSTSAEWRIFLAPAETAGVWQAAWVDSQRARHSFTLALQDQHMWLADQLVRLHDSAETRLRVAQELLQRVRDVRAAARRARSHGLQPLPVRNDGQFEVARRMQLSTAERERVFTQ